MALPLQARELVLAEKGKTVYTIVVSGDAIKPETYAAEELAGYLKKVTGAPFRVVKDVTGVDKYRIIVGQNALSRKMLGEETISGLAEEEFIIRTEGSDLLIVGGRPRGTLYGVYEFLEKYAGCRWFNWWGEEYVPQRERIAVSALDIRQSPAFRVRDIVVHTNPYSNREVLRDFLVRSRCQGPELNFTGDMDTYGGTAHTYVVGPPHIVHTSFWFISPPGEYKGHGQTPDIFAKHPEYFTFDGSKRTPRQLCFSNPEVRKILTERVLDKFEEVGGKGTLSLSAEDSSWDVLCECPDCLKLIEREHAPGAPLFDFLAELGPILKRKYPEAFISTLAYRRAQTEKPPRNITLPENVIVLFAPIDNNFAAPFEDQSNEETFENIKAWTSVTKRLWVWYYPNPYGDIIPIGNLENAAKDFRFFRKIGVEGFFVEHSTLGIYQSYHLADLQTWLLAKLMWNPDQNFNTLIEDFTNHFYGKAAPFIRKYLYALEKATQEMTTTMHWSAGSWEYRFLTPGFLVASQKTFEQAEEAVLNDPVLLLRVRQARMSLDHASFLFWRKIAATIPDSGLEREEIVRRYRDTHQKTVEKIPQNRQFLSGSVEDFFSLRLMMNPTLKPLPAPLNEIPEGKVQQVTPDSAVELYEATIEKDPDSAAGIAVARVPGSELPFNLGYYDRITERQLHRNITKNEISSSGYNLYKIGRTTLNEQCLVWIGASWVPQFPVSAFYDVQDPGKEWDIYASLRFEGPSYPHGQKGKVDRVFVDRVVLVPVEE